MSGPMHRPINKFCVPESGTERSNKMKISNKLYDILKWLVIIVLPALATLYAALAAVWAWPDPDQVVTTITAVDTFLGAVLCISSATYNKEGKING